MRKVTSLFPVFLLAAFLAMPSSGQTMRDVTFQVDLNPFITSCQYKVDTDSVLVRGSFNDWSNSGTFTKLTDTDNDGIYTVTLPLEEGSTQNYKFWLPRLTYESGDNRTYTVTADAVQLVPVATPNLTVTNECGSTQRDYEIEFKVDMSVAQLGGFFNPETDIVTVAGGMNGWSTTTDTLQASFFDPNVYSKVVRVTNQTVPGTIGYKFVIGNTPGTAPSGWESISDRQLVLTGNETDENGDGTYDATNAPGDAPYYNNVTPNDVFTEPTTITYEVDLRPAYYFLADNGRLPSDTQTGDPVTSMTNVALNGPAAGAADRLNDWATWGPNDLGSMPTRVLVDNGTGGDRVAGDSVFTIRFDYRAGTPRNIIGKFGTDGWDNEGGFGANQNFNLNPGEVVKVVFGAIREPDGTYTDRRGPANFEHAYDEYIMIDSSAVPNVVTVVRRGGTGTAVEPIGTELPESVALGQNYPNPFNPSTAIEYSVDATQHVALRVFDVTGRVVATLVDGVQTANTYRVTFDARDLPSGMYIYQLQAGSQLVSRKMMLVK